MGTGDRMGTGDDERLDRAPFRVPRPRRSTLGRSAVCAALLCLAWLILVARPGEPAQRPTSCRPQAARASPRPAAGRPRPPNGLVGVPVSVNSAGAGAVLEPGDHVTLLRADGATAAVIGRDVLVLSVGPAASDPDTTSLYVATTPDTAYRLASVPDRRLTVTVRSS